MHDNLNCKCEKPQNNKLEDNSMLSSPTYVNKCVEKFLTVERANKAEIYISTAREQKSLGMIGVRHDGYHVAYKVLVRHVGAILGLHQFR